MMLPWQKRPLALNSPRDLPGLALWLDSKDVSSLRNGAGAQPVTTDGIKLASDKSGNSSTNVLCLNGVAGNYASAPDSAAVSITGDIDIRCKLSLPDWSPAAGQRIVCKWGNVNLSYILILSTTGALQFYNTANGTTLVGPRTSTADLSGLANYSEKWIRVTLDVNDGASGNVTTYYTSDDGVNWAQLGLPVTLVGTTSIYDGNADFRIGVDTDGAGLTTGNIFRVQVYNGIAGTLAFYFDPSVAAKLAGTVTERSANAATVTINTSGATGARISGARDLYQRTAANQPILTIAASGNYLTFDGSNDYLKAAAFSLSQPETVYFVGSQVTFTSGERFLDGNGQVSGLMYQAAGPTYRLNAGSDFVGPSMALATPTVVTGVINGAASAIRTNRNAAFTGNSGAANMNGLTIGADGLGVSSANITAQEVLVYSGAHDKATQERVIAMLARNNRIALT